MEAIKDLAGAIKRPISFAKTFAMAVAHSTSEGAFAPSRTSMGNFPTRRPNAPR
jgi:hypothetical protein